MNKTVELKQAVLEARRDVDAAERGVNDADFLIGRWEQKLETAKANLKDAKEAKKAAQAEVESRTKPWEAAQAALSEHLDAPGPDHAKAKAAAKAAAKKKKG